MREIRVGIAGSVGRGRAFFTPLIENPHATITALCDLKENELREQADRLHVKFFFTDYNKLLDSGEVDAVVIGTPMPLHAPMAIEALERDIHVLSEVPASVSIEESERLVIAAHNSRAKYMLAENVCYVRRNVAVREMARQGLFGEIYFGEGAYIHELKELNETTRWRRKWQTGINGITYGTHSLGPVLQWFDDRVTKLCCYGSGHHYHDPRGRGYENEDTCHMSCRLSEGGLVNVRVDMLSDRPANHSYASLQGTDGCYEGARGLGDQHKVWIRSIHGDKMSWHALAEIEDGFLPDVWLHLSGSAGKGSHEGGDYMEVLDFVESILEDREPAVGIHEAMDMTMPGLVSQQSIVQGSNWLDVPDSRCWLAKG